MPNDYLILSQMLPKVLKKQERKPSESDVIMFVGKPLSIYTTAMLGYLPKTTVH